MNPQVIQQALARPFSYHNLITLFCEGVKLVVLHFDAMSFVRNYNYYTKVKEWSKEVFSDFEKRFDELENTFMDLYAGESANNGVNEEKPGERIKARQDYFKHTIIRAEKC
ncbi:uncharacterized protein LOC113274439 [Papaver somniferum]|uniref:uncharacterized protein LOC113274439 n=1 Tax=Papaver somniferum TaxID=3469 RepID=UPI000E6FED21|nr:uncharacterized protein LOC113274439 [Papaver somniferum]